MTSQVAELEFGGAKLFPDRILLLRHMLQRAPSGLMCEFGVGDGTTLKIIAADAVGRRVIGFDSFRGLPEDWRPGYPAGVLAQSIPPDVAGAELRIGMFADTLPVFLAENDDPIGFVHIDCDLYSSAATVLELVVPKLAEQAIIVFDEFHGYLSWENHEYRAWQEFVTTHNVKFSYLAYSVEQVGLRIEGIG